MPSFLSFDVLSTLKIKAIEDEIALGQIEEVIVICKDELILVDFYHGKFNFNICYIQLEPFYSDIGE